ncbi:MAG: AAA family ATPase [Deltaproteobacteria bacterium]|jgi:hypothetical protein|nr:AAA family ATPase [Deltaproteobacteria bacterium]
MFQFFVGVVVIGAAVVRAFCDELSEEERAKQRACREEYDSYKREKEKELETIKSLKARRLREISVKEKSELEREIERHNQNLRDIARLHGEKCGEWRREAGIRIEEKENLKRQITETIKSVKAALKDQNSMLRRNSLLRLRRELEEAYWKTGAYIAYLKKYVRQAAKSDTAESEGPFEFTLPQNFFYFGKLLYWRKEEIKSEGEIPIPGAGSQKYRFKETEYVSGYPDGAVIPLMCGQFDFESFETELSAKKGEFKDMAVNSPRVGVSAVVKEYDSSRGLILDYGNDSLVLHLRRERLLNEKRFHPLGAALRVFPVYWTYSLDRPVEVSERPTDSYVNYSFSDIPVVFSESLWTEFEEYLLKHELHSCAGEWKIAPYNEEKFPEEYKVKLQLDTDLVFYASIVSDGKRSYFSYEGLLAPEYMLTAEDVFLSVDCTLNVVLEGETAELEPAVFENMTCLTLAVLAEFKVQKQIKSSRPGMQYFNKWSEITEKLITYLQKGAHAEVRIGHVSRDSELSDGRGVYRLPVEDPAGLKRYIDGIYENAVNKRFVEFFIEPAPQNYCFAAIRGDGSELLVSGEKDELEPYLTKTRSVTLYERNFCYAEYQQAGALHRFRAGKVANQLLQGCALDGSNISSDAACCQDFEYINATIASDGSQSDAVRRALEEMNIFLIQGPPGTGKTTVIREIISQFLRQSPASQVLVVSQANVAVDNVLKGFIGGEGAPDIIRCGHSGKIDPMIEPYSFERAYETYVGKISAKSSAFPDNGLLADWLEAVGHGTRHNPDIGELLLKGASIIGATCVGLSQKRIGLDRMAFDLVVIDEAGKALPAEALLPYIRAKKVILLGDHRQLPPTVHPALLDQDKIEIEDREIYENDLFNSTFFSRMFESAPESNKRMLTVQYRMPASVGTMVSRLFYDGMLTNGPNVAEKVPFFFDGSLTFIDVGSSEFRESDGNGVSPSNLREARLVIFLLNRIRRKCPPEQARIAVITPYKGQKRLIIQKLMDNGCDFKANRLDVNTVDAFQGDEAEITIFCTTRTVKKTPFFTDSRRLNVAFSRARNELIIIGSLEYFRKYGSDESPLRAVAAYVEENGEVLGAGDLGFSVTG